MALYLGSDKVKINLDGITYCLNLYVATPILNNISLLSSDNYLLRDINGLYLLPKIEINGIMLETIDDYILKDIDGLYLTVKESE